MKLDNEASHELQRMLKKNNIDFQLVPPSVHRRNAAERCIHTFKIHFITTILNIKTNDIKHNLVHHCRNKIIHF